MTDYYTEDLTQFGYREIELLNDTLTAWTDSGLPQGFYECGIKPAMNQSSGYVFLVNEEYQVAMLNDDRLEIFHSLPYSGKEGFLADLIAENTPESLNADDVEYLLDAAEIAGVELDESWTDHND